MRYLFCILFSPFLFGCTTLLPSDEFAPFETKKIQDRVMSKVAIEWVIKDDIDEFCNSALKSAHLSKAHGVSILACSIWNTSANSCTIFTSKITSHVVLGHELRHCFEGQFHR